MTEQCHVRTVITIIDLHCGSAKTVATCTCTPDPLLVLAGMLQNVEIEKTRLLERFKVEGKKKTNLRRGTVPPVVRSYYSWYDFLPNDSSQKVIPPKTD